MNAQPFLARFAQDPLNVDSGGTTAEPGSGDKHHRRIPDTKITKVDRETTDDR